MRIISGNEIDTALNYPELIETLLRAYRSQTVVPEAAQFAIERPNTTDGMLRLSPAWTNFTAQGHTDRGYIGCSLALDLPQDSAQKENGPEPASALYLLFSGTSGYPIALLDGLTLGAWRKCAEHALATRYLAREDACRLLVLGATPLLARLIRAYTAVRKIRSVLLMEGAETMLSQLSSAPGLKDIQFGTTDDWAGAIDGADIICLASGSSTNLAGQNLAPGTHIDVIDPDSRLDRNLLAQTRIFASDRKDASSLSEEEIAADLYELSRGEKAGRRFYGQNTLFQSGRASGLIDIAVAGQVFLRS